MTNPYNTVIFDFFGVFAPDVFTEWLQKHGQTSISSQEYFFDLAKQMDEGQISMPDFFQKLATAIKSTPEAVESELNDFELDQNVVNLVETLAKNYKLALLCNASSQILWPILEKYRFVVYFDEIIISSEVGMSKPDPQIYILTLNKLGKQPSECVFIDDRLQNIEAADQQGIKSLLYNNPNKLQRDLERLGIILAPTEPKQTDQ